jgi:hypothetical protein
MGKSQVLTRGGPAWISGRDPRRHIMVGAYNQTFAAEFGDDVRNIMGSPLFRSVFPKHGLRKGATDLLDYGNDGKLAFVGVGGSGTGKPADFFFVDDPIRNDEDAQSAAYREKLWKWFNRVVFTRCHGETPILVVHTRWHEDDLIGRLCDPDHPERNKSLAGISEDWTYINIPAVVSDPKLAAALGLTLEPRPRSASSTNSDDKPIAALWPRKFPLKFLAEAKRLDPQGFSALRMGKPTPKKEAISVRRTSLSTREKIFRQVASAAILWRVRSCGLYEARTRFAPSSAASALTNTTTFGFSLTLSWRGWRRTGLSTKCWCSSRPTSRCSGGWKAN